MPDSVDIPAPVKPTTSFDSAMRDLRSSTFMGMPMIPDFRAA
jgi:hypothetical protein